MRTLNTLSVFTLHVWWKERLLRSRAGRTLYYNAKRSWSLVESQKYLVLFSRLKDPRLTSRHIQIRVNPRTKASNIYCCSSGHMVVDILVDNRILIEMELDRIEGHLQANKFLFIPIIARLVPVSSWFWFYKAILVSLSLFKDGSFKAVRVIWHWHLAEINS